MSPVLLECPAGGCEKKFPSANGLQYHMQHKHNSLSGVEEDSGTSSNGNGEGSRNGDSESGLSKSDVESISGMELSLVKPGKEFSKIVVRIIYQLYFLQRRKLRQ